MNNKEHERSRRCPACGWKFPIAKVSAPIDRIDGKTFNCPDCRTALVYRTESGPMYRIFSLMTIPAVAFVFLFRDSALLETIGAFVILPLAILAVVIWRRSEFIELVK
ncbi:hypothetical protein [Pseudoalteromonas byunsanensis]|uniref:Cxxc_20_cxxc protein n=1 Tax=Pseudoalteromonas byunsanensis TaxID=327939 RepID=A0A1S1ND18_9GAMM|nr:hypothetical protein [Pseudoalteromonas byunsanensis]OHU97558.1 hypothetical protein BIW53_01990 [Pseudoalteromonas byunsanensis]